MADLTGLLERLVSQQRNCEHLYAIAITSDDPKWPIVTTKAITGDDNDEVVGPAHEITIEHYGLSPDSPLFQSRPLACRWITADAKIWQLAFFDNRQACWYQRDDASDEHKSLMAAIESFEMLARSIATELTLPPIADDNEDKANRWYARLIVAMRERRDDSGNFFIRTTGCDMYSESLAIIQHTAAKLCDQLTALPPATGHSVGNQPVGVSLRDAALLVTDGDRKAATTTVRRWSNLRSPELPTSIGFDPLHSQAKLYPPAAILQFVKIVEALSDVDFSRNLAALNAKARCPRQVAKPSEPSVR